MNSFQAIFLGLIQGLTEFIPVSSSGHLVIAQYFLDIKEDQILFNVILHIGTLIPIFIIFWQDIKDMILLKKEKRKETFYILLAIIPTGIIGVLFEDFFENLFANAYLTALMLIVTGLILYITEKIDGGEKEVEELKFWQPLLVGLAQGGAIIPGISRSGTTIAASLFQGLNRKAAARFSFLMSIPVIGGAGFLQLLKVLESGSFNLELKIVLLGFFSAVVSGYFAIKLLVKLVNQEKLSVFAYYCWILGLIIILGCAHRGIINTINYAKEITGIDDIYMVIGGTHTANASEQRMNSTINEIKRMDVKKIGVSHCTGLVSGCKLSRELGKEIFFHNNAGSTIKYEDDSLKINEF